MTHKPVLKEEVVRFFQDIREGIIIDGTLGSGGHSEAILSVTPKTVNVLGLDRDPAAAQDATHRLSKYADRFIGFCANFGDFNSYGHQVKGKKVTGFVLDLGLSSTQLDSEDRGFSFHSNKLDMRFNPSEPIVTAEKIINEWLERDLADIIFRHGEERHSRRIAASIVAARRQKPIQAASELAAIIERSVGRKPGVRIHPATKTFQALRIAVNDELQWIKSGLEIATKLLSPGGRLAVISFHSLEDRIIKQFFIDKTGRCRCPRSLPECICNPQKIFRILTPKPITGTPEELQQNPRARSAKLRVAERVDGSGEIKR